MASEMTGSGGLSDRSPISKSVAVTTSGAGYVTGRGVGGIISLASVNNVAGRRVTLNSVQINDKDNNSAILDVYFFKATPAAGTYTDNVALVWGTGDSANKVGQLSTVAADWLSDGSQCSANYSAIGQCLPVNATTLFVLIVAKGSYTFTNGNFIMDFEFDTN